MIPVKHRVLFLIIAAFTLWKAHDTYAQVVRNQYVRKISSADGLSHNIVLDIAQDDKGFIWVATQDGLNRFDGYTFKNYRFRPGNSSSLSGNYINDLYFDNQRLWISTRYGLNRYDPRNERFYRYQLPDSSELDITAMAPTGRGNLWVANYAGGFHLFHIPTEQFIPVSGDFAAVKQVPVMSILEDRRGWLWVGTEYSGLYVLHQQQGQWVLHDSLNQLLPPMMPPRIEVLYEDSDGNCWMGTRKGVFYYQHDQGQFTHIQSTGNPAGLSDNIILDIHQDAEGNLLIGTQEGGLNILDAPQWQNTRPGAFRFRQLGAGTEAYQLSYRSVQALFADRDSNLWIGTFGNGLNLVPEHQPKFSLMRHNNENPNGLNYNKIWGICADTTGNWWIGTDGMGLNRYHWPTHTMQVYQHGPETGLSDDAILSALCDSKGRLWLGTYEGGLNRYQPETDDFVHYDTSNTQALQVNDIRCVFEASDGIIWLGTNGGGVVQLNPETETFHWVLPQVNGWQAYDIRSIAEDSTGRLWLGSYGSGLFAYHPESGQTGHFAFNRMQDNALKCNIIYTLHYDETRHCLWIGGSQNGGLNRLNLADSTFQVFDMRHGLANNNIHALAQDTESHLWLSTDAGISQFVIANQQFTNYNYLDGVQRKEFASGSVLHDPSGRIAFGGSGGLNYFHPAQMAARQRPIDVLFTDLRIFDQRVPVNSAKHAGSLLTESMLYTQQIELNHRQNNFSLSFTGLYYANPKKIHYQYMLEGADMQWNALDNQRQVAFRNLKAGDYTLKVRASNEAGNWNKNSRQLQITVLPPPWRSWWAYLLYGLLIASLVWWIYHYNMRQSKIQHNLLWEKKMRAQENQLHEDRIKFFMNISHELRTPLMLLINPLEDLMTRESQGTRLGRVYYTMYRSANSLLQLINTLLEFRKTETGQLKLRAGLHLLSEQVAENVLAFQGLAAKKQLQLRFKAPEKPLQWVYDRDKLDMILNNLLSNAIKHTPANKHIDVHVWQEPRGNDRFTNGYIALAVADEGPGIPADQQDKIFQRFYQVRGSEGAGGTGIGLALTKRLVELHGGQITVNSQVNQGTTFTVYLPHQLLADTGATSEIASGESPEKTAFVDHTPPDAVQLLLDKIATLAPEKKQLLIIEDHEEVRDYLKQLLQNAFRLEEAADGREGLEKIRKLKPALVISDIMMPRLNGVDLCRIAKSELEISHIPVLLITANVSHHVHINSLDVGADGYFTKPFKTDLLLSRIYNLLQSREKLHQYYVNKLSGGFVDNTGQLNPDEEFLMKVHKQIQKHLSDSEFSVKQLHEQLHMSRTAFYHKIKSLTNLTPIELIREIRLKKAADLLTKEHMRVYEAMMAVGFNDAKHFRQLFKKHFGVTPSEYGPEQKPGKTGNN